jgi:uncharacterized repeat protein (TIGR01451 family)
MKLGKSPVVALAVLMISILPTAVALASGGMASDNFRIPWSVLGSGGCEMTSSSFKLQGTLSQVFIGLGQSDTHTISAGYWAGVVPLPDLSVQKGVSPPSVEPGGCITYTIVISNSGAALAQGAVLSDTLPTEVTCAGPVQLDPPGAGTTGVPPILVHDATIAAGASITITFPVTINTGLAAGALITNTAAVSCSQVPAPDEDAVPITVANARPTLGTVDPSSGSGPTGVTTYFTTTWQDANGWEDLKHCYFHIGDSPSIVGNVTLLYNAVKNKMWLRSDDGGTWTGGHAPGSSNTLENSQAIVHCDWSSADGWEDTLAVRWGIEFKPAYTGSKKTGLKCKDRSQAKAKGKWKGTWSFE